MSNEMKALVKAAPEQGLWLQMVPVPELGPSEVLIKVRKSAICGTDVHIWNWDEWSAKTVPVPIPDDIPDEIAALFDPLGNAVHTALSFDLVGEDVLVTGAGPIGIMGALVAQKVGARKVVITDINPYRLQLAERMGVQYAVDVSKKSLRDVMGDIGMSEGFDVGLEMSGAAPAMRQMIERMNNGGKLALLGIAPTEFAVDWNTVIFNMLEIKGIYGREMFETWYKMIALVQSGLDISGLITHRISIEDYRDGFAAMTSGHSGKVVMDWGD